MTDKKTNEEGGVVSIILPTRGRVKSGALERQRQPLGLPLLCNLGPVSNHSCSVLQRSQ